MINTEEILNNFYDIRNLSNGYKGKCFDIVILFVK